MNFCSKCGQPLPRSRFRIIGGPAVLLFLWPALDVFGYAVIPRGPDLTPYLHGASLAVSVVFVALVYAWVALSGTTR